MTDHDADAAIGALTKRYSEAKRQRAAAVATLEQAAKKIEAFHNNIRYVSGYSSLAANVPRLPQDYPETPILRALLEDIRSACEEMELTHELLKDAGVEVS